jgi:hypothetical protein
VLLELLAAQSLLADRALFLPCPNPVGCDGVAFLGALSTRNHIHSLLYASICHDVFCVMYLFLVLPLSPYAHYTPTLTVIDAVPSSSAASITTTSSSSTSSTTTTRAPNDGGGSTQQQQHQQQRPPPDSDTATAALQCRRCEGRYCAVCQLPSHSPAPCRLLLEWERAGGAALLSQEDLESRRLVYETTRRCPRCGTKIERNGGCLHMTCKTEGGKTGCGCVRCVCVCVCVCVTEGSTA